MQNELADDELVRLIAYVSSKKIDDPDNEDEIEQVTKELKSDNVLTDEYLIDVLTVGEAKIIGSEGIFSKVVNTLIMKEIIKDEMRAVTWRLIRKDDLTPSEEHNKKIKNFKIKDLRHLH